MTELPETERPPSTLDAAYLGAVLGSISTLGAWVFFEVLDFIFPRFMGPNTIHASVMFSYFAITLITFLEVFWNEPGKPHDRFMQATIIFWALFVGFFEGWMVGIAERSPNLFNPLEAVGIAGFATLAALAGFCTGMMLRGFGIIIGKIPDPQKRN